MKVTVTCLGPSVFELEGDATQAAKWLQAFRAGKPRTITGPMHNGEGTETIIVESIMRIGVHDEGGTANRGRRT